MRQELKICSALILAIAAFIPTHLAVKELTRAKLADEINTALPPLVQIAFALGDRNLAANVSGLRSLVVSTSNMQSSQYTVLARVQADTAWLNPMHEDNYYIAAAILPWEGQLAPTQFILERARLSRTFDWQPGFYEGFNIYHFDKAPVKAADTLIKAAQNALSENDKLTLLNIAARWYEKGYEPALAKNVVEGMAKQSNHPEFRAYLETRSKRLEILEQLQMAANQYQKSNGKQAINFEELLEARLISQLPTDPFGFGYYFDREGKPQLRNTPQ
ncbi:hypothetical protein HZU75_05300 [Chitinibacter fontanus]|uniref:Uncharacterized protein n=1 Tax=Chitinibacter fontanus TaxID=1737446 RepID=A0A7D5ZA03_9NEIS|nr:hypothetical protein [Chitinibacter fontanus]QLI80985.1 hypothetical protein HZU75_05300 [Chitinibacter fontanus]